MSIILVQTPSGTTVIDRGYIGIAWSVDLRSTNLAAIFKDRKDEFANLFFNLSRIGCHLAIFSIFTSSTVPIYFLGNSPFLNPNILIRWDLTISPTYCRTHKLVGLILNSSNLGDRRLLKDPV